jgi:hypothetical protein
VRAVLPDLLRLLGLRLTARRSLALEHVPRLLAVAARGLLSIRAAAGGYPKEEAMTAVRSFSFLEHTWYVLTCEYAHEHAAKQAWNQMNSVDMRGRGELELGVYRHAVGHGGRAAFVSVVSHKPGGMEVAERVLVSDRRGKPVELGRDLEEAMIARRVRVMAELSEQGAVPGGYTVRRPDSRGGVLQPDGTMLEQIGGDE